MGFQAQTQGSLPAINAVLLYGTKISTDNVVHRISRDPLTFNARYTKRAQRRTQANDQLIESPTARTVGLM